MDAGDNTSLSLLDRVTANDPEAWEQFSFLYRPLVLGWCRHFGLDQATAEDLTQEIFINLCRKLDRFEKRKKGDSFRKWLRTVVSNRLRSWYRERRQTPVLRDGSSVMEMLQQFPDHEPIVTTTGECSDDAVLHRAVELIKAEFEFNTWQAFWRYHIEDEPTATIATELGMSAGAARKARWRVMHRLRSELDGLMKLGTEVA